MRRHCHHAGGRRLLRRQRRATAAAGPGNPGATSPKVCSRRPQPALAAAAGLTAIRRRSSGRALPLKLFGALTRRSTATRQRRAPATPGPPRQRHFRGAPGPCRPLRRAWRRAGASAAPARRGRALGGLTRRSTATRQRRAPATPGPPRQRHFRGGPGACWPMRRAWRRAGASAAGTRHWHLDEAREKKRWLRAKIPANCNSDVCPQPSEVALAPQCRACSARTA